MSCKYKYLSEFSAVEPRSPEQIALMRGVCVEEVVRCTRKLLDEYGLIAAVEKTGTVGEWLYLSKQLPLDLG